MPTPTVLLTAFEPFGGEAINASLEAARQLDGQWLDGARVQLVELPCVFGEANRVLTRALRRHRPSLRLVVALGQASGRRELSVERVAVNLDDARIADNAGAQPVDQPVVPSGPTAHFSTLPVKAMVVAMRAAGVPAGVSASAGSFVCNHVFYGLQHRLRRSGIRSGFVHVPQLPEQERLSGIPGSMPLEQQVRGLRAGLLTALTWQGAGDLSVSEGTVA